MNPSPVLSPDAVIPPLREGDRLDWAEFERRSNAMPHVKKAELLEGVVHMAAALRFDVHGLPHALLMSWLGAYWVATPGVQPADNTTVRLDDDNAPQPDAFLMIASASGGRASIDAEGYMSGGPELACEVAASSVRSDRSTKMRIYRQHGVCEYLLWRVEDGEIDWFILRDGQYVSLPIHPDGSIRSEIFPGLWLDSQALIAIDPVQVIAMLQEGLATAEHAAFVERLRQAVAR